MSLHAIQVEHPAHKLRRELNTYLVQAEHSSKSFVTRASIEKCWPDDLQQLRRKLGLPWEDNALLSVLAKKCRVIACILAWIEYEHFSEKLQEICRSIQTAQRGQDSVILKDSQLSLPQDQCVKIFGLHAGHRFHSTQFIFCPILISSAADGIHEVPNEGRWPYKASPVEIGFGAYGRVYKVAIAKGQLQTTKDESNDKETMVAYKRVSKPIAWLREVKTLDFLKSSLSKHNRLLLHIAAFIQGEDFLIFLPYTPYGDLETFLREGTWQDDNSEDSVIYDFTSVFGDFDRVDLAREFAAIIDATGYLHEGVSSVRGLPVYCAHVDLRTKNILVFPGDKDNNPAGVWHISDFGISSIKLEGDQALPEPVWSKYPSMGDIFKGRWDPSGEQLSPPKLVGPHVAPEMSTHGIFVPKESDMWSLGCIFMEILVFGLTKQEGRRKKKLDEFRGERRRWAGSARDDYFFDRELQQTSGGNKWNVIVSRRQKVDEWLTYLHNQCGELYQLLAATVNAMLQPDPRQRRNAKLATKAVITACEKFPEGSPRARNSGAREIEDLHAHPWKFLASRGDAETDSTGRLSFLNHLEVNEDTINAPLEHRQSFSSWTSVTDNMSPSQLTRRRTLDDTMNMSPVSRPSLSNGRSVRNNRTSLLPITRPATFFTTLRGETRESKELSRSIWPLFRPLNSKMVANKVSASFGVLVCLCQKQEVSTSSPKTRFGPWKGSRREEYELQFGRKADDTGALGPISPHSLPQYAKWLELRIVGRHAIVTGHLWESSHDEQRYLYDFIAGAEVEMPEDKAVSRTHKFASSGDDIWAAYDEKGFALWQPGHIIYKQNLSPELGSTGQVSFGAGGSFLFTWSIYEHSMIWIWSIDSSAVPEIMASYRVPSPIYRGSSKPLLFPCGSLPACIIRTRHGTWYTTSAETDKAQQEPLMVVEQKDLGKDLPHSDALCKANERHFFYLCGKGVLRMCDLVWDDDNGNIRLIKRSRALAEFSIKNADSMGFQEKANDVYEFIVSNQGGEVESIEVEVLVSRTPQ